MNSVEDITTGWAQFFLHHRCVSQGSAKTALKPFPSDEVRACLRSPHCGFISGSTSVSHSCPVGPVNAWWSKIKKDAGSGVGTKRAGCVGMQHNMTFLQDLPETVGPGSGVGIRHAFKIHTSSISQGPRGMETAETEIILHALLCSDGLYGKTWLWFISLLK